MEIFARHIDNLQEIFDNAKTGDTVYIAQGVYTQKVEINVSGLTIVGVGEVIIEFGDCANKIHADGRPYNTFRTYTVAVCADNVTIENVIIANTTKNPEINGQAIALTVYGNNFAMKNCKLLGMQDTLFCGPLPDDLVVRYYGFLPNKLRNYQGELTQTYNNCIIVGTVDFIFGSGSATFNNCEIVTTADSRTTTYVAAPSHNLAQVNGFLFNNCNFTATADVQNGSTYLGRPWRDFGKCHFSNCTFGKHIHKNGFHHWDGTDRQNFARFSISNCTELPELVEWAKVK